MSISKIFIPNLCKFSQIFILLPKPCPGVGLRGAGGVKNLNVGICDGAASTAHSSSILFLFYNTQQASSQSNIRLKFILKLSLNVFQIDCQGKLFNS